MTTKLQTRTITGNNQFCDAAEMLGYFNISISGTNWIATVTAQRSFDSGSTWYDVNTWTENTQEYGFECERGVQYRAGVKTDEYTSGTLVVRISQ